VEEGHDDEESDVDAQVCALSLQTLTLEVLLWSKALICNAEGMGRC